MPSIVVIEPHALYRLGIIRLLSETFPNAQLQDMDYKVLESGPDIAQKIECELLLLAIPSPEVGLRLLSNAQRLLHPEAILLMADSHAAIPSLSEAVSEIVGYLLKSTSPELMVASINLVLAGGTCFPFPSSPGPVATAADASPLSSKSAMPEESLLLAERRSFSCITALEESQLLGITPRQYEVLVLLARGMTIKGIARELDISAATAKAHAETLYMRMSVNNRNQAVYQAVVKGARLGIPSTSLDDHHNK